MPLKTKQGKTTNPIIPADKSQLHIAVEINDVWSVRQLLQQNADINCMTHQNKDTPLHFATALQNKEIFFLLLYYGADIDVENEDGLTPLHVATKNCNYDFVDALIKQNANMNCKTKRSCDTPLHIAAGNEDRAIFHALLSSDLSKDSDSLNCQNKSGMTPLSIAVEKGFADYVDALLKQNVDVNCLNNTLNTPVHTAISGNRMSIFVQLVKKGASLDLRNKFGLTPLHIAVQNNYYDFAKALIDLQVDVNCLTHGFETPLHFAVSLRHKEMMNLLIRSGANVDCQKADGETPVLIASRSGFVDILETFLLCGANVNLATINNQTPLQLAVYHKRQEVAEMLIRAGADLDFADKDGESPLLIAARNGYTEVVKLLLSHGARVSCISANLETPLHLAIYHKRKEIFELLLNAGADVNARDRDGETPLHLIIKTRFYPYGFNEGALALIMRGADINLENNKAETPLTIPSTHFSFGYCKLHDLFIGQVLKLQLAKAPLNDKNLTSYYELKELCKKKHGYQEDDYAEFELALVEDYVRELEFMRGVKFSRYSNLYDFLYKEVNSVALYTKNIAFQKFWETTNVRELFPHYGHLLEAKLERGLNRRVLLNPAKDSLELLTRIGWPDPCCEGIFKYLSDETLQNLIFCTNVNFRRKNHISVANRS